MAIAEKTYTFRASKDLGPRAREALGTVSSLLEESERGPDLDEAITTFWLTFLRRANELGQVGNQSAVFRTTLEVFIEAAEKLARDQEQVREYEAWAAEDEEARAVRRGALKAGVSRWDE